MRRCSPVNHIVGSGQNTFTTPPIDTTDGESAVVWVTYPLGGTVPVLTDSAGNTWTNQGAANSGAGASGSTLGKYSCGRDSIQTIMNTSPTHTFTLTGTNIQAAIAVQVLKDSAGWSQTTGNSSGGLPAGTTGTHNAVIPSENFNPILPFPRIADGTYFSCAICVRARTSAITFTTANGVLLGQVLPVAGVTVGIAHGYLLGGKVATSGFAVGPPSSGCANSWSWTGSSLYIITDGAVSPNPFSSLGAVGAG